jgi:hypothetical protein
LISGKENKESPKIVEIVPGLINAKADAQKTGNHLGLKKTIFAPHTKLFSITATRSSRD